MENPEEFSKSAPAMIKSKMPRKSNNETLKKKP